MSLISLTHDVLNPYKHNKNTGNIYEISTALFILRAMGLKNEDLDACTDLFQAIRARNISDTIDLPLQAIKSKPVGNGFSIDGEKIVGLKNVTQDDGDGKTGDLLLITETGKTYSLSVCEGKPKRDHTIEKCLTNPSASRLGVTQDDISRINTRAAKAVVDYKAEFTQRYGADETKWPTRVKTTVATDAAADVATWTAERFGTLSNEQKQRIFRDVLRIDDVSTKPADYLALVNKTTLIPVFYKFEEPRFTEWAPTITAEGIYLLLKNQDRPIGRIQVKFNCGVYHKGKTSSLCSSWNLTCNLTDVFGLKSATIRL